MNKLQPVLMGFRLFGPKVLSTVWAALQRDRLERRHRTRPASGPFQSPGPLFTAERRVAGAHFRFARADLEVTFLASDLVRITRGARAAPLPYAIARSDWPPAQVDLQEEPAGRLLTSPELALRVDREGGLAFCDPVGRCVRTGPFRRLTLARPGAW